MEKVTNQNSKLLPMLLISFILFIGMFFYTGLTYASTSPSQPPGTQLAYFIGYHSYGGPGYIYYGPKYRPRGTYWTGWRYIGHGCKRSCLIERWSGRVIRCTKRCY
ncbi:hypothetical protein [Legionella shakespearei]|uniref:Uncharacterized protein n=1 Tax=Legionella shakespearei DSM 23087 TaxID=1122169 RepID=A0A0W0YVF8_9GAMM|nr:hypothetical protein [Legionella shakespearei]KTD60840.1 hypothetical protein Lsha_1557 [Legionella shakespearei DSM 23087]